MKHSLKDAALILIDVQNGFDDPYWGKRNNPNAESNMVKLLHHWRSEGRPVVHVRHMSVEPESPLRPGQAGNEFKNEAKPMENEHIEEKIVNSAFIGTNLEQYLRANGIDTVVIAGLTTDHCVSTSTRMSGNLGFKTFVVADATATFNRTGYDGTKFGAEDVHSYALASLNEEFATVVVTADIT
jgi:nicotinamidase-related amidase